MSEENAYGTGLGGEQGVGTPPASNENVLQGDGRQPNPQEQTGNEQITLTRSDLEALIDQRVATVKDAAVEEATRRAQSMTDKLGSRLDKELGEALDQAKSSIELITAGGVKLTPDQEQRIRDQAVQKAYAKMGKQPEPISTDNSQQPPVTGNEGQGQDGVIKLINSEVQRIMSATGVYISPEEADKMIVGDREDQMSPFEYIEAFRALAQQKQLNNQAARSGRNPNVASYAVGAKSGQSETALRQQYEKEMAQVRAGTHPTVKRGQTKGIQDLEIRYRNRGLNI